MNGLAARSETATPSEAEIKEIVAEREYAARCVALPIEPTEAMLDALTDRMWKHHTAQTVWAAFRKALATTPKGNADLVKRLRYEADLSSRQAMLLDDEGRDVSAQCLRDCAGRMREAANALSERNGE